MDVKVKVDTKLFDNVKKALTEKLETRVGVLAGSNARDGAKGNALIGATQEFGSLTNNIPARSWLRMPIQRESKNIAKAVATQKTQIENNLANGNSELIYAILGVSAEAAIQKAFDTGGFGQWAPKKEGWATRNGFTSPLIVTGQLRGAVLSEVKKKV